MQWNKHKNKENPEEHIKDKGALNLYTIHLKL